MYVLNVCILIKHKPNISLRRLLHCFSYHSYFLLYIISVVVFTNTLMISIYYLPWLLFLQCWSAATVVFGSSIDT